MLYELGKKRVIAKRELASNKTKVEPVNYIGSIPYSQRIVDLYELGKHEVMTKRKVAAEKLLPIDNLTANAISKSGTKVSPSEITGQRLFTQAKLNAERIARLRIKAKETPLPHLELETEKRYGMMPITWGTSAIERFLMLYEKGKSEGAAERELEIEAFNEKVNANERVQAGYANTRQLELYTMGTQRIIDERSDERQHNNFTSISSKGRTRKRLLELYMMGTQRLIDVQSDEKQHSNNTNISCKQQTKIEATPTMIRLYEMSKHQCT